MAKHLTAPVIALSALALVLSACGSAAAPSASSAPPQSAAAGATSAKPAPATSKPAGTASAKPAGSAAPAGSPAASLSGKPVNVALFSAFTGPSAALGQSELEGTQVAVDEIAKAGGILGGPVHIVPVNAPDAVDAVTALRKSLATDNLNLMIGFSVIVYANTLPITNAAKMVTMNTVGDPALDTVPEPYSFHLKASDAAVGKAMAAYASQKGFKKIALVLDASAGAQTLGPPIEAAAKKLGLDIVAKPAIPDNVTSYQGEALQVINAKPDAILTQMNIPPAGIFFRQLNSLGGQNLPIIGSDYTQTVEWVKAAGGDQIVNRLFHIVPTGLEGEAGKHFLAAYQTKFNHPPRTQAAQYYDGMVVAALAMNSAKSVDPTVYVKAMTDVSTPGAGHTAVYNFADGAKLLAQGKKIKYFGASGPLTFVEPTHTVDNSFQAVKVAVDGTTTSVGQISAADLAKLAGP
ncbi:MAG TPA: ABC transporter substrate-binding protein [Chloroflexota bacterium]|nr:ABC transporter substrate-binding protein [Chloroflexota bacterium]